MSALGIVLAHAAQLKGCAFKTYAAISEVFERNGGREVELSYPALCSLIHYSRASVTAAVRQLDESGLVIRISPRRGGANLYSVPAIQRSEHDPVYSVQRNPQDPVQSLDQTTPYPVQSLDQTPSTLPLFPPATPTFPSFSQPVYKEVLSSLLSIEKTEATKPEEWKTQDAPPPGPKEKTFSVEVVEFAEVCMGKKIFGVLRTQFGTLPDQLGIEPGIVAEFVARKWNEVWTRGRGKLHEKFTPEALYGFVRKDLAKAFGIELQDEVRPPRRPPTWEHSDHGRSSPYAAGGQR